MLQAKQLFTAILLGSLLFSPWGGVKAQQVRDRISNGFQYGAYTRQGQNAIINNDPGFVLPIGGIRNPNEVLGSSRLNLVGGFGNTAQDAKSSLLYGSGNRIEEFDNGVAIGKDNLVGGIIPGEDSYAIGKRLNPILSESMALGFGAEENRLNGIGERAITIGTYSANAGEAFNTLNVLPPSRVTLFEAPGVGIGTAEPQGKLNIVNRGAIEGENGELGVALNVQKEVEFITPGPEPGPIPIPDRRDDLFNVRDDGAAGFNIPANPGRPRAPYQFEESQSSPFGNGQGRANIVQNYSNFPQFEDCCPPNQVNNDKAKWLALGERPPGQNDAQVAYGLANVWDNNAGNFILLDQDPDRTDGQSDVKDLAITFQDVGTNGGLTDDAGRNRIRFLFRNSQPIEGNPNTPANDEAIYELMSLEPTGEVGVGDYTNSTQQANLEVKAETQNNGDPIFQVRNNGGPGGRGNNILTVNDDGRVGIGLNNPNDQLEITSGDPIKPGGGDWDQPSDRRLKKGIKNYNDGLDKVMEIKPVWYQYNSKMKHVDSNEKHVGVIAQDTKEVAPYMVDKSYKVDSKTYYSMNSSAFTYMLINAVQKQQKQLKAENAENDSLRQALNDQKERLNNQQQQLNKHQEQIDQLRERLIQLAQQKDGNAKRFKKSENLNEKTVSITAEDNQKQAMLLQNRPNPYSGETIIPYYLPKDFETANILITNTNGQMIKRVNLEQPGKGELTLRTQGLNAGQYFYSLTVDGQKIQTRKMVKSRK